MKKINILAGATLLACGLYSCDNQSDEFSVTSSKEIKVKVETSSATRSNSLDTPISTDIIDCGDFSIGVTEYDSYDFSNTANATRVSNIIDDDNIDSFKMDATTSVNIVDRETGDSYGNIPFDKDEWSYSNGEWSCNPKNGDAGLYWSLDNTYYMWSYKGIDNLTYNQSSGAFDFTQDGDTDVLVAYNQVATGKDSAPTELNVHFYHAMAAIQFQAEKFESPGYKITKITIDGIKDATKCEMISSNGKIEFKHDASGTATFTFGDLESGESASNDKVLFVVPQDLEDRVEISWTIESTKTGDNVIKPMTRTATFNSDYAAKHKWKAGHRYVYELGSGIEKTVTYEFTSDKWDSKRIEDNGGVTGPNSLYWAPDKSFDGWMKRGSELVSSRANQGMGNISSHKGYENSLGLYSANITDRHAMRGILIDPLLTSSQNFYVTKVTLEYQTYVEEGWTFGGLEADFTLNGKAYQSNDRGGGKIEFLLNAGEAELVTNGITITCWVHSWLYKDIACKISKITIHYIPWQKDKDAATL